MMSPHPNDCAGLPLVGSGARGHLAHDEALELEAATWAVRCLGSLDAENRAALNAWLAADPQHATVLAAVSTTLQGVQQLPQHEVAKLRAGLPKRPRAAKPSLNLQPSWWQSYFRPFASHATAAAVVFGMACAGWFGWWVQPTFEQSYASARGQQLVATLPDSMSGGSTVQLDSNTQLQARLFRDRREVKLNDGQAMFAVHPDKTRPFHVLAGNLRITVLGTRFSVRHTTTGMDAGRTVVAVEEGRVRVESAVGSHPAAGVELVAGQVLEGADTGDALAELGSVTNIPPAAVAQWRSGRISFNQTPLHQALAEFERYGPTNLVVRDPVVAAMPVGGSYGLRQSQRFAEFLPQLLPVRLVLRDGVTEIVTR